MPRLANIAALAVILLFCCLPEASATSSPVGSPSVSPPVASPSVSPPSSGTAACKPTYAMKKERCERLVSSCSGSGIVLKYTGVGCRGKKGKILGDGGCQCDEYCGYKCRKSCNRDKQCKWNAAESVCYNKASNTSGTAIPVCTPTATPVAVSTGVPTTSPVPICFHASSTVELEDGSRIRIDQVKYGDKVLSFDDRSKERKFSEVIAFTGFFTRAVGTAVHILTNKGDRPLIVSPVHLVLAQRKDMIAPNFIQAALIEVGTIVYRDFEASTVVSVKETEERGWITPLTKDGTIVVDGFMASCHTTLSHSVVRTLYTPLRWVLEMFPREKGTQPDDQDMNEHWYSLGMRRSAFVQTMSSAIIAMTAQTSLGA